MLIAINLKSHKKLENWRGQNSPASTKVSNRVFGLVSFTIEIDILKATEQIENAAHKNKIQQK